MHHWVDRRIEAHMFICLLPLQIQRLMRQRLKKVDIRLSPEVVLEKLPRQRTVKATANGKKFRGLVRATDHQLRLFRALNMPAPQHKHLYDVFSPKLIISGGILSRDSRRPPRVLDHDTETGLS